MIPADILSASDRMLLVAIDGLIASAIQRQGCPMCSAALHASHYPRKPRGLDEDLDQDDGACLRLSFCCSRDGCRHRVTPPSVRFWNRLGYWAPIVLAVLRTARLSSAEKALRQVIGCSGRSIARWRERFASIWSTATGRMIAGSISLDADQRMHPDRVFALWVGRWPWVCVQWLLLIHPLTGGTGWERDGQRVWPLDPQSMRFDLPLRALQDPPAAT